MSGHVFAPVGGNPVLDFLDTVHDWTAATPRDYLETFADARRFGVACGLLSVGESRGLHGADGKVELERLRRLRDLLERIFRRLASDLPPDAADLDRLTREQARAARAARLRAAGSGFERVVAVESAGAAVLRLRLADAAVELLTSGALARVKACPACGWYFADASKNGSRRWCSMATCGSSAKARAYYRRKRQARHGVERPKRESRCED